MIIAKATLASWGMAGRFEVEMWMKVISRLRTLLFSSFIPLALAYEPVPGVELRLLCGQSQKKGNTDI